MTKPEHPVVEALEKLADRTTPSFEGKLTVDECMAKYAESIIPLARELVEYKERGAFVSSYNAKAKEINETAVAKGWWDAERNDGEMIALMHSELSEALEALRHGNPPDSHIPEFNGVEAEMADVIIRIMDFGLARGYRIAEAIEAKMVYNKTRPHKHGGKKF